MRFKNLSTQADSTNLRGMPPEIKIAGIMTGTSCDGLDIACMSFQSLKRWRTLWTYSAKYPVALQKRVFAIQNPSKKYSLQQFLELNRDLGHWYALELKKALRQNSTRPDAWANHGQTVAHYPFLKPTGVTLQMGDPSLFTFETGITSISQFRVGDLAAGGQGAPLVPRFHRALAEQSKIRASRFAIQNIGGISNVSCFVGNNKTFAWDTGPGNIWIDAAIKKTSSGKYSFDQNGDIGKKGKIDFARVQALLNHGYFKQKPPKSTGRDDFSISDLEKKIKGLSMPDAVATATEATALSIAHSYKNFIIKKYGPLKNIWICGGGAKNAFLLHRIRHHLKGTHVESIEKLGLEPQMIEAQAFAYFGYLSLLGMPIGGNWTGAKPKAPPGFLLPGTNWISLQNKIAKHF